MKTLTLFKFEHLLMLSLICIFLFLAYNLYIDFNEMYNSMKFFISYMCMLSVIFILVLIQNCYYPVRLYKLKKYSIIKNEYDNYVIYYKYFLFYSEVEIRFSWERDDDETDIKGNKKNRNSFEKLDNAIKCIAKLKKLDEEKYLDRIKDIKQKYNIYYKE